MKIWLAINSFGILLTATLLYLVVRQVGLILNRLGPIGARSSADVGPRVGENLSPVVASHDLVQENGKFTLLVFGSDSCGICAKIRPATESLVKYWRDKVNILMVYDGETRNENDARQDKSVRMVRSNSVRSKLGIGFVPFGVIVDSSGVVLGKGLVNDISHLESLLELTSK